MALFYFGHFQIKELDKYNFNHRPSFHRCYFNIFLIYSLLRNSVLIIRIGLFLSIFHLSFNLLKYQQVKDYVHNIAIDRKHQIKKIFLNQLLGIILLWRSFISTKIIILLMQYIIHYLVSQNIKKE